MSMVVRNNFNDRNNKAATLKLIQDTLHLLEKEFGKGCFSIYEDEEYGEIYIMDNRQNGEDEFIQIDLFDGFWLIDTPWRYSQYFDKYEGELWLRKMMYKYVKLLGMSEAYVCTIYQTWNSSFWKEEETSFDYWYEECCKNIGHEIKQLDIQDVIKSNKKVYDYELAYLDNFSDMT